MSRNLPQIASFALLLIGLLIGSPAAAQSGQRGFVPRHEKLIRAARQRARRDLAAVVRSEGSEGSVDSGSRIRRVNHQTPYYEDEILNERPEIYVPPGEATGRPGGEIIGHGGEIVGHGGEIVGHGGEVFEHGCAGGCGGCGGGSGGCGPMGCGPAGLGSRDWGACDCVGPCQCPPCACGRPGCCGVCFPRLFRCGSLEVMGGVQGFTGPMNRGAAGSFGNNIGFNYGTRIPCLFCGQLGAQIGVRGVFSNYSGASFTTETREQLFLTTGVYRRMDWGLQGGIVIDYLAERWYAETELLQARGEVSWVMQCKGEVGFNFRARLQDDVIPALELNNNTIEQVRVTDTYAFFYRHRFLPCGAGEGRIMAGWTRQGDGLLSSDIRMPLDRGVSLESGYTYLIPKEDRGAGGAQNEAWNVFVGLVWQPGCPNPTARNYYRPLFRVADNGSFLYDVD